MNRRTRLTNDGILGVGGEVGTVGDVRNTVDGGSGRKRVFGYIDGGMNRRTKDISHT